MVWFHVDWWSFYLYVQWMGGQNIFFLVVVCLFIYFSKKYTLRYTHTRMIEKENKSFICDEDFQRFSSHRCRLLKKIVSLFHVHKVVCWWNLFSFCIYALSFVLSQFSLCCYDLRVKYDFDYFFYSFLLENIVQLIKLLR